MELNFALYHGKAPLLASGRRNQITLMERHVHPVPSVRRSYFKGKGTILHAIVCGEIKIGIKVDLPAPWLRVAYNKIASCPAVPQFSPMQMVTAVQSMQRLAQRWRRESVPIGFVPTMGYLHEGHLSLVHRARQAVGATGRVVVSIYVNPTQFAPREDLSRYPRDLPRDKLLCQAVDVNVLFVPKDHQMYPQTKGSTYSTYVAEEALSQRLEGKSRPTHFRGVTTVVAKLFNIILPDIAVFGAKDWQQAAIIRRMTRDLNFPVRLIVAPTMREPDGLAMSSRNQYLSPEERPQATALWQAIQTARQRVRSQSQPIAAAVLQKQLKQQIQKQPAARVDYVEFFHSTSLEPVRTVTRGTQLALAVYIGRTRLIDNATL